MSGALILIFSLLLHQQALAQVVCFEADGIFPEASSPPWTRVGTFDADRWFSNGRFFQFVELGAWAPPPYGEFDGYQRSLADFANSPSFFIEWRVITDVTIDDINGTPVVVSAAGDSAAVYHVSITNGRLRFIRDNPIQVVYYFDFEPNLVHTFRVEITSKNYCVYVDDNCIHSGTSIAAYPLGGAVLVWAARYYQSDHTAQWNYLRYGSVPDDHSGDFDSNSLVDFDDLSFFVDCLLGPGGAWPGCKWADMNADGIANGADVQLFANALLQ